MSLVSDFLLAPYKDTPTLYIVIEFIAFVFGILSVWYSKKENILVYPVGLVATVISVYLLYRAGYFGDMMMNFYYSAMSLYGWWNWSRKKNNQYILPISKTDGREKLIGLGMFFITILVTFLVYKISRKTIASENYIDIFTSGIFFTGMWYMAQKKIENWTLWIVGDIITVPLYAYRGLGMLSLQYLIFTIMAVQGYLAWKKALDRSNQA